MYVPLHTLSILEATQEVTGGVPLHPPEQCQRRANKTRGLNKTQSHPTLCPKCPGYAKNEDNLKRNKKRWPQTQHGMTPTSELSDKDSEAATLRTITRNRKSQQRNRNYSLTHLWDHRKRSHAHVIRPPKGDWEVGGGEKYSKRKRLKMSPSGNERKPRF